MMFLTCWTRRLVYIATEMDGWMEPHERIAILSKLATLVEAEASDFAG
jgi:hypothetical protein